MKRLLQALGVVAVAVAALPAGTIAADMPDYPVIETPEPAPLPAAGAWYLRGDIGYKFYNNPEGRASNADYGALGGVADFSDEDMGEAWNVGVGVGYKFNQYFRTDFTLDYETPGEFYGRANCVATCGATDYSEETANISAWSGLVNGYVDLGTYGGLTPYVGAGIGASYLRTSGTETSNGGNYSGDDTWNFAWALMAGASYAFTPNWSMDVGYRYINLGDARSADLDPAGTEVMHVQYNDIDAHEVRVGLRYTFN